MNRYDISRNFDTILSLSEQTNKCNQESLDLLFKSKIYNNLEYDYGDLRNMNPDYLACCLLYEYGIKQSNYITTPDRVGNTKGDRILVDLGIHLAEFNQTGGIYGFLQ